MKFSKFDDKGVSMQKLIKIPINNTNSQDILLLDGSSVIEQCILHNDEKGTMHLDEHVLLLVLEGRTALSYGKQNYLVEKHELTLLKKGTVIQYEKLGNPNNGNIYHELIVVLKDTMIKSFLATTEKIISKEANGALRKGVHSMTACLVTFTASLRPFFNDNPQVYSGQLRLKMTEMLYQLGIGNSSLFQELTLLRPLIPMEIRDVMEQHFASRLSLNELAALSGRSLSTFKRDFQHVYNISPAVWIRGKRLEKAKEMLETTQLPVTEICFTLGFENMSHFSRIFKQYHRQTPTSYRSKLK